MELMGIADEASPSIDGQIRATKELGWKWIEARFAEVDGFEKGPVHDIPDEAFDIMAAKLEDAGVGIYALGSTICNWAKTVDSPWDVTVGEIDRAIPRMQRLGTKFVRIMSCAAVPHRKHRGNDRYTQAKYVGDAIVAEYELSKFLNLVSES